MWFRCVNDNNDDNDYANDDNDNDNNYSNIDDGYNTDSDNDCY